MSREEIIPAPGVIVVERGIIAQAFANGVQFGATLALALNRLGARIGDLS